MKLPRALTIPLDTWNRTSEAHAVALLKLRGRNQKFNELWKVYWDTLPPPEYIASKVLHSASTAASMLVF